MPDLQQLLEAAAQDPCEPLDTRRLGRRIARTQRYRTGLGVAALVAAAAGVMLLGTVLVALPLTGNRVELAGPAAGGEVADPLLVRIPAAPGPAPLPYSACLRGPELAAARPTSTEPHIASRLDPAPGGNVALTITNHSDEELSFGWECAVHRWQGRGWSEEVRQPLAILYGLSVLHPGASETLVVPVAGLEPGPYRVVLRIPTEQDSHRVIAQFVIESDGP